MYLVKEALDHNLPRNLLKGEASAFLESPLMSHAAAGKANDLTAVRAASRSPVGAALLMNIFFYRNSAAELTRGRNLLSFPFFLKNASVSIMNGVSFV